MNKVKIKVSIIGVTLLLLFIFSSQTATFYLLQDRSNNIFTINDAIAGNGMPISITKASVNNNRYNLNINGEIYPIIYVIYGSGNKLDNITTIGSSGLRVNINSQSNGTLTIGLPRNVIHGDLDIYLDYKNGPISGESCQSCHQIKAGTQTRTFAINFDNNTASIEVLGDIDPAISTSLILSRHINPYYLTATLNGLEPKDLLKVLNNSYNGPNLSYIMLNNITDVLQRILPNNIEKMISALPLAYLANNLNDTSAENLIEYINSTAPYKFKDSDYDLAKLEASRSTVEVANLLNRFPQDKSLHLFNNLSTIQRIKVLNEIDNEFKVAKEREQHPISCSNCAIAPLYIPTVDFSAMLQILLINATPSQISQIPLAQYSPDDVVKVLDNLSQANLAKVLDNLSPANLAKVLSEFPMDKHAEIISKLPQDKRTEILKKIANT